MSATRDRIRDHVSETPGVHFNQLSRDLDLATGQVQYHIRKLSRAGEITAVDVTGKTHYFDPIYDPWEQYAIAYLRRETTREIVVRLHANGPMKPARIATELDLARSTIEWHLSNLDDHNIVTKSATTPLTVSLVHPDRTADLLEEISPSLPERLVDRFIRTVDELLE